MSNKSFTISLILVYIYALIHLKPEYGNIFVAALVISTIVIIVNIFFQYINRNGYLRCLNYMTLLGVLAIFMLLMTILHGLLNTGNYSVSTVIQDIISVIILSSGFLLTSKKLKCHDKYIVNYLKLIGIVAILSGLISLIYADFSVGRVQNVWKPQYVWWGLLFPWSYILLYKVLMKEKSLFWNILSYGTTTMYIVLGLLFSKRIVLFELALILIIIIIATKQSSILLRTIKIGLISICLGVVLFYSVQQIFNIDLAALTNDTWDRLASDSLTDFDRLNEFEKIFEDYPYSILITGAGLGSYHNGPGGINLHIGWLNFIFKGGVLFLCLELWVFSIAMKTILRSEDTWHKYIASCVLFYYVTIMISSSWVSSPLLITFSVFKFALLRVTESKHKTQSKIALQQEGSVNNEQRR